MSDGAKAATIRCTACGHGMPMQALFCMVCGERLPPMGLGPGALVGGKLKVVRPLSVRSLSMPTALAQDAKGEQFVIKELRDDLRPDPAAKQAFQETVRTVMGSTVPGIPPVKGVVAHGGRSYAVLPYLQGHTLRSLLARGGRLPVEQAVPALKAALRTVAGMHQGFPPVLHGMICPEHLLYQGWDACVLLDGLHLRELGHPKQRQPFLGQPYLAPEAVYGQMTPTADLYALGVSFVEAISGAQADRLYNAFGGRLNWEPVDDPVLQAVLTKMVSPGMEQRYRAAGEALSDLENNRLPSSSDLSKHTLAGVNLQHLIAAAQAQSGHLPQAFQPAAAPQQPQQAAQAGGNDRKLTAAAQAEVMRMAPPAPPPPPPPPPAPPPRREVKAIPTNLDEVSTEEGLDALMALYESQNS